MFSSKHAFRHAALAVAFLFAAGNAFAVDLIPGDIVIVDAGAPGGTDGAVLFVPATGGPAQEIIASTSATLSEPISLALETSGNILVLDAGTQSVVRVNPDTETAAPLITSGLTAATAVAVDANGRILVLDAGAAAGNGAILAFLANGTPQPNVSQAQLFTNGPVGMVVEAAGTIAVTTTNTTNPGVIVRVNPAQPAGANQVGLSNTAPIADPTGIAVNAAGALIFGDPGLPGILGLAPTGGTAFLVSNGAIGYAAPTGVAVEADGNVIVVDAATGLVSRVDPTPPPAPNANQTGISSGAPLVAPSGVQIATVPEPTSMLAQGTAMLVLGLIAARRRRA